jgi:hypothetical protein
MRRPSSKNSYDQKGQGESKLRIRGYVQTLNVNVDLCYRQAGRVLDCEFDPVFDSLSDLTDPGAGFNHDVEVNCDAPLDESDVYSPSKIRAWQNLRNIISQMLGRHSDHTIAFEHGLAGDARDCVRRDFDFPEIGFTRHGFAK